MQSKTHEVPFHKLLRTKVPVKNWCNAVIQAEESHWDLKRCIEEASHFLTREQWEKESPVSYYKAAKRGWLTKCCSHIKEFRRKNTTHITWTLDRCLEVSRQCNSRSEFNERFRYAYEKARLKGWLSACCAHMK